MNTDELNIPSKESIERATYLLNHYSKDSHADIICLALAMDRRLKQYKDLENKKLDPKQPICTKCVNNLTYHDGWHCMCEEKDFDRNCWINFGQTVDWEKCADNLVDYAHEFVAHLSTWEGYNRHNKDIKKAEDAIEQYHKLKNETT